MKEDRDDWLRMRVGQLQQQVMLIYKTVVSWNVSCSAQQPELLQMLDEQLLLFSEIRKFLEQLSCQNIVLIEQFDRLIFERKLMLTMFNNRVGPANRG